MKVKVTSSGITKKGTPSSSHMLNNTKYHLPTVTTISAEAPPYITIPRVPNKPSPVPVPHTPASVHGLVSAAEVLERKKNTVKITNLTKNVKSGSGEQRFIPASPTKLASVYYAPPTSSLPGQYTNKISKPKVQTVTSNVKPVTQAIRISQVQSKKIPVKSEPLPTATVVTPQARKITAVKQQQPVSTSTGKVKQKQVILKHTPGETPAIIQSNKQVIMRQDVISSEQQSIKPGDMKREKPQSSNKKQEFVSSTSIPTPAVPAKPAVKRKAETVTSKNPPAKIPAKASSKGDPIRLAKPDDKVTGKNGANTPASSHILEPTPLPTATKPKKPKKSTVNPTSGKEKQLKSPLQYYDSPKSIKVKKQRSAWVKHDKTDTPVSPIAGEIRDLLHAFGDSSEPLSRSVQMMETCLKQELAGFISICEQKANLRGARTLGITEAVLALKWNIPRINRMYKHFGFKDIYERKALLQSHSLQKIGPKKLFYIKKIRQIILELNLVDLHHLLDIGLDEIESSLQGIEDSKLEEAVRSSPEMLKFYQYAKTRSLSFARKLSTVNIRKWIITLCHVQAKVTDAFICVLDFLTLELVAELVDLAFDIRKERLVTASEVRVANPDTCMSAPFFLKKRKDDRCNQVSEILVQASEMEATRLKKEQKKKLGEGTRAETVTSRPLVVLYPDYICEAYMRIQADPCRPSPSFRVQANIGRPQ